MPRARKICSHAGNGRTCSQLAEERSNRCAEHKRPHGWSNAKTNSPYDNPEWRRLQPKILQRDEHRCRLRFSDICEGKATQVDHLGGVAAGGSFLRPIQPGGVLRAVSQAQDRHDRCTRRQAPGCASSP